MHASKHKDPVVLNGNVRDKGFILEHFLFEALSHTPLLPHKKPIPAEATI